MMDIAVEIRNKKSMIAGKAKRKFTDKEVILIKSRRKDGLSYRKLAEEFGISSKSQAHYIVNNTYKTKK